MSAKTLHLDLDPKDVRILVQSLQNCLKTCETRAKKPDAPCEDCDAARSLQEKLEKSLRS
jgi:hypothetical protein